MSDVGLYRDATVDDMPFITKSWIRSYAKHGVEWRRSSLCHRARCRAIKANIAHLLKRPDASLTVVCNPDNPSLIWGFAAYEPGLLHFVYVKELFRGMDLGTELASLALGTDGTLLYTHCTPAIRKLLPEAEWKPSLARKERTAE